jgi:hypothetical protein
MKTTDDWLWECGDRDHLTCSTTSWCSADNKSLQRSVVPSLSDCLVARPIAGPQEKQSRARKIITLYRSEQFCSACAPL